MITGADIVRSVALTGARIVCLLLLILGAIPYLFGLAGWVFLTPVVSHLASPRWPWLLFVLLSSAAYFLGSISAFRILSPWSRRSTSAAPAPRVIAGLLFAAGASLAVWLSQIERPDFPAWLILGPLPAIGLALALLLASRQTASDERNG